MQVKANPAPSFPVPVSAPPASLVDGSVVMTADEFRPSRLNGAKVCLWCETRYCASPECERQHAASVWAPCPECNGFRHGSCSLGCINGVVEVAHEQADEVYVLPMVDESPEELFVKAAPQRDGGHPSWVRTYDDVPPINASNSRTVTISRRQAETFFGVRYLD